MTKKKERRDNNLPVQCDFFFFAGLFFFLLWTRLRHLPTVRVYIRKIKKSISNIFRKETSINPKHIIIKLDRKKCIESFSELYSKQKV